MSLARLSAARSRRDEALDALREAIIDGRFGPGDQLKQDVLGSELGVSSGVIREVLRQLESEGLVRHIANRGVFVTEVSADELFDLLLPVRVQLESYAARRALPALGAEDFRSLAREVDRMVEAAAAGDATTLTDADVEFHRAIVRASGSAQAEQLWASILPRIRAELARLAPKHRSLTEIVQEHRELLLVLRSGNRRAIAKEMNRHILDAAKLLDGTR